MLAKKRAETERLKNKHYLYHLAGELAGDALLGWSTKGFSVPASVAKYSARGAGKASPEAIKAAVKKAEDWKNHPLFSPPKSVVSNMLGNNGRGINSFLESLGIDKGIEIVKSRLKNKKIFNSKLAEGAKNKAIDGGGKVVGDSTKTALPAEKLDGEAQLKNSLWHYAP